MEVLSGYLRKMFVTRTLKQEDANLTKGGLKSRRPPGGGGAMELALTGRDDPIRSLSKLLSPLKNCGFTVHTESDGNTNVFPRVGCHVSRGVL